MHNSFINAARPPESTGRDRRDEDTAQTEHRPSRGLFQLATLPSVPTDLVIHSRDD